MGNLPKTCNQVYSKQQAEGENVRYITARVLRDILHKEVPFKYARRVGKRKSSHNRRILINLRYLSDKQELLRQSPNSIYCIQDFKEKENNLVERLHMNYAKRILNLNKYASNTAVQGELGRHPLLHKAWGLAIKYWLRLTQGTSNVLLNAAFRISSDEEHSWIQSIKYLLENNGFGYIFLNPITVSIDFGKHFVERLNDQFKQTWKGKIQESSRFKFLNECKEEFKQSQYLTIIKNHEIRNIFTRLRVDMNILSSCKYRELPCCPICKSGPENLEHFVLHCPAWGDSRIKFFQSIEKLSPSIQRASASKLLKYILDLQCPEEARRHCCTFIRSIYQMRQTASTN